MPLKPKCHSLRSHDFMVHALLLRMHTNVVIFRVMRRLCGREWNWLWNWRCVNQHSWDPWQRTTWSRRVTSDFNSVLQSDISRQGIAHRIAHIWSNLKYDKTELLIILTHWLSVSMRVYWEILLQNCQFFATNSGVCSLLKIEYGKTCRVHSNIFKPAYHRIHFYLRHWKDQDSTKTTIHACTVSLQWFIALLALFFSMNIIKLNLSIFL